MLDTPSRSNVAGATRRYDDFVATHIIQAEQTHFVVSTHAQRFLA